MYENFYKLKEKPFSLVANPEFLYMSAKHKLALTYLEYGIREGEGFILLTGEIGTGKTTLVKKLLNQMRDFYKLQEVGVIFNTNISSQELLELILQEFEIQIPHGGKAKMLDTFYQFLIQKYQQGARVLLIIDEAQNLLHDTLEEVRMLSNLQSKRTFLLQTMLVGQPELKEKLQNPAFTQLTQRIAVSYHLFPLKLEEIKEYIVYRLQKAHADNPDLFTNDAIELIYHYSGGIPRVINILCDAALVYGYADELPTLNMDVIDEVVKDKQQLGILPSSGVNNVPIPTVLSTNAYPTQNVSSLELLARIQNLEERVKTLTLRQEWLIQQLENDLGDYHQGKIFRELENTLPERQEQNKMLESFQSPSKALNKSPAEYLTAREAAVILGVSTSTIYRLVKRGELKATKIKSKLLISRKIIDSFFKK